MGAERVSAEARVAVLTEERDAAVQRARKWRDELHDEMEEATEGGDAPMSNDELRDKLYEKFGEVLETVNNANDLGTLAHAYAAVRNANQERK
jgi:hypothetical protein